MINPLDLPTAAGQDYGRGDVRHFSEGDAVDVPSLQNPSRQLAQRDNLITSKLNEVIGTVNNREQFVPLVLLRTTVVPGTEEILTNFRIPVGFEARVLNAAVASNPASTDLTLKILYSSGFGAQTGTELTSVTDEYTSGTSFYNDGELIVTVRNNGSESLEASASVTLTIRPIGEEGSLLVGSVITGPRGYRGEKGQPGQKGDAGSGTTGSAIVWKGTYSALSSYVPGDAVYWADDGNSYLCSTAAGIGVDPSNTGNWDSLVVHGYGLAFRGYYTSGSWPVGAPSAMTGPAPLPYRPAAWVEGDVVSYYDGSTTTAYVCILGAASTAIPPSAGSNWSVLVSGASGSGDLTEVVNSAITLPLTDGGSYSSAGTQGDYLGISLPYNQGVTEIGFRNPTTGHGAVFFSFTALLAFQGTIDMGLPTSSVSGVGAYAIGEVNVQASSHGSLVNEPPVRAVKLAKPSGWSVAVDAAADQLVGVTVTGLKVF